MTDRRTRREFMGLTAAGAAGMLTPAWLADPRTAPAIAVAAMTGTAQGAPSTDPDLVVFNAKVYTMDPAVPRAEAFATSGGRFIAVGSTAAIKGSPASARRRSTRSR